MLEKTMGDLRRHNDSEESADMPLLDARLGPEGSAQAAAMFEQVKVMMEPDKYIYSANVEITFTYAPCQCKGKSWNRY